MMSFLDGLDPESEAGVLLIFFGFFFVSGVSLALVLQAPFVLLGLGILVFPAWAGTRLGLFAPNGETTRIEEHDPLTVLQERYARGDISDEEFGHRLITSLGTDELAGREPSQPDRDHDPLTERTQSAVSNDSRRFFALPIL